MPSEYSGIRRNKKNPGTNGRNFKILKTKNIGNSKAEEYKFQVSDKANRGSLSNLKRAHIHNASQTYVNTY